MKSVIKGAIIAVGAVIFTLCAKYIDNHSVSYIIGLTVGMILALIEDF